MTCPKPSADLDAFDCFGRSIYPGDHVRMADDTEHVVRSIDHIRIDGEDGKPKASLHTEDGRDLYAYLCERLDNRPWVPRS